MGMFGIFSYFAKIDKDGSGYLELNEIEDLAKDIFGEEKTKEVQAYVHRVFKEYDDDDSGELSYEEARNFIKGIYTFFEKAGNLTEEEKRKLFGMIEETEEEPEAAAQDNSTPAELSSAQPIAQQESIGEQQPAEPTGTTAQTGSVEQAEPVFEPVEIPIPPKVELPPPPPPAEPTPVKPAPVENKPVEIKVEIPPVVVPEPSEEVKKILEEGPKLGPNGELLGPDGKPLLGPNGELLGADGKPLLGPNGEILGADGKPLLGKFGELLGPDGKSLLGKFGHLLAPPDAKALLGKFNEIRGADGNAILGPSGEILGEDGCALLGSIGELLGPDGQPLLGKFGQIIGPGGVNLLGPNGEILAPGGVALLGKFQHILGKDGAAILGEFGQILDASGKSRLGEYSQLLGPDGKSLLGKFGELLGADGKSLLGPNGELIGADGRPLLGPNGELLGPDGKGLRGPNGELIGPGGRPIVLKKAIVPKVEASVNSAAPRAESQAVSKKEKSTKNESNEELPNPQKLSRDVFKEEEDVIQPVKISTTSASQEKVFKAGGSLRSDKPDPFAKNGDDGFDYSQQANAMQAQVDKRKLMEKLKKEKLAALRANRPTGHDGWFEQLQIYLPKPTACELPDNCPKETKFFRDPISKQWISVRQIAPDFVRKERPGDEKPTAETFLEPCETKPEI